MLPTTKTAIQHARQLRKNMTIAEQRLWSRLRCQQLGVKFRKQTPIGHYIVDFYCHQYQLVIELDGSQHLNQQEYDTIRSAYLKNMGITVLRYWNHDILQNTDAILIDIQQHIANTIKG